MASAFSDLEKILLNEKKNYENRVVIGGMEPLIANWAARQKSNADANAARVAEQVFAAMQGYAAADRAQRGAMLLRAIELLRGHSPAPREKTGAPIPAPRPTAPPRAKAGAPKPAPRPSAPPRAKAGTLEQSPASAPESRGVDFGLQASIAKLQNIGPAHAKHLQRLGIETVQDLLYHFPHRYDDYSHLKKISELLYGEDVTLILSVMDVKTRETMRKMSVTTVILADQTGSIQAVFFNQPFLQRQLRPGEKIVVSGRVEQDLGKLGFKHLEWEPLSNELLHTARIVPVYPLTEGITNRWLRRVLSRVVEAWAGKVPDPLPSNIRDRARLLDLKHALLEIHYPSSIEKMQSARRRLAFDEFLVIQLGVLRQRRKWREQPGKPLRVDQKITTSFLASLPFQLTGAQKRALDQILGDIQQSQPMSRLLQGDVGSGKTVVAAAAMLSAVVNGSQAALLAPTEILAEQHFKTLTQVFSHWSEPKLVVERLTGSMKPREKEAIRARLGTGEINIVVGTHALIQEGVEFQDLALAVIDEQHRFGVEQRAVMRSKGYHPHILVMSATPIPRSLALTLYGDLDLSIIDEMPPGRQEIKTRWLEPKERERAYAFIRKHAQEGRQAFVICPLIEVSETIDAKAAVEEYERLKEEIYPDLRVGLVHGKLRPAEKDETMNAFRDHTIDVLVATSVVEVGIDVPNATVMLIEGADRFGLAQLHQFRGRVGRGEHQSFCLLLSEKTGATSDERLRVIESTQDGFKLAEEDLKLRGPGEFFGTRQSGLPDLKVAKLSDVKILEEARGIAQEIFDRDPGLQHDEYRALGRQVDHFWKGKGDLS
ncbi:MAG: ATP-dependent DNA helicase RecG [Chloroflexi bacterium]|nr:ATP-dependent DNA helicase RecG [Chloroflexota bacterium]